MSKYRKKPVVIEAFQWGTVAQWPAWFYAAWDDGKVFTKPDPDICFINTLEGEMKVDKGDWIIRGVKGELYPCKPDIFAETYEAVGEEAGGYWWLNRFNLIEMDGPFSSIEAAKADAVRAMNLVQNGMALDIVILNSKPEEPMPEWAVVAEGYIENGKWFDGANPKNRHRVFKVGDRVREGARAAVVLEVEKSGGSGLSQYKIKYDDGSTLSNISGYALLEA